MLMTIDVGNTNISVGIYENDKFITSFRLTTQSSRTSDEFAGEFYSLMQVKNLKAEMIKNVIISSVVPNLNHSLQSAVKKYFKADPLFVSLKLNTGIKTKIKDLGADRIVDLVAAKEYYGPEVLVLDFGTATTYDYIDKDSNFVLGVTAPGIGIEADALTSRAAQLPKIEIRKPESIITHDTIGSMQAGVVYGYIGSVEYIIETIHEELHKDFRVIATGGLGSIIVPWTKKIEVYDPDLAYKGMKLIWEKNH